MRVPSVTSIFAIFFPLTAFKSSYDSVNRSDYAAKVVSRKKKYDNINPTLKKCALDIEQQIQFKLLCLDFKCIHDQILSTLNIFFKFTIQVEA